MGRLPLPRAGASGLPGRGLGDGPVGGGAAAGYLVPLYYMVGAALGGEEPFSVVSGAWPLLATAYYVWQGIFFDRWGSAWLVFPTIPLVCIAFDSLDKWWRHRK